MLAASACESARILLNSKSRSPDGLANASGHEIKLTASEFAIMRHLVEHPDQVIGVETILSEALNYPPRMGNPQVIHTHIKNIRTKFRAAGVEPAFLTSSRQGYMLVTAA